MIKLNKYMYPALFFREQMATAKAPDGREVELSLDASGAALIAIVKDPDGEGSTYTLRVRDIFEEIFACESGESEFNEIHKKEEEPKNE